MGGGVVFSASPATVSIPTDSVDFTYTGEFTIPQGVHVVKARLYGTDGYGNNYDKTTFVAVTPNKKYKLIGEWPYERPDEQERFYMDPVLYNSVTGTNKRVFWIGETEEYADGADSLDFIISWSPEINTHTPDVTDY